MWDRFGAVSNYATYTLWECFGLRRARLFYDLFYYKVSLYIPANQSLMTQSFGQPLKHNLSQKNPIKYPSLPTMGHISVCSVVINISPRKVDFIGPNKVRPKQEPWGVDDFFIHRNGAKFTATTSLLNLLCCTVRASGVKRNTYWIQLRKGDRETT